VTSGLYQTVAVWPTRFASQLHGDELINAVCAEKLVGMERGASGAVSSEIRREGIRRISAQDVGAAPSVLMQGDIGRDVFIVPGFWEEARRAIISLVGPRG
jgi:hypothetical protein